MGFGRWLALSSTWLAWFWSHGTRVGLSAITPYIRDRMHLSIAETAAVPALMNLGFYTSNLASGHLARRLGYKRAIGLGAIGSAVLFTLAIESAEKYAFYSALVGAGIFLSLHLPSAIPWLSNLFGGMRRGFYIGVHESAAPAGQTLGPIILTFLIITVGMTAATPLWSTFSIIAGSAALILAPSRGHDGHQVYGLSGGRVRWRSAISFIILTTGMLVGNLGVVAIVPLYLVDSVGLEKSYVATIIGASRLLGVLGQPAGGLLYDRFGFTKVVTFMVGANIISSAYIAYGPYNPLYIAMMVIQAASTAMYFPVFYSHVVQVAGDGASVTLGRVIFASGLIGPTAAPLTAGLLAEMFNYHIALTYPLVIATLGIIVLAMPKTLNP
jgi:MFS family permease